MSLHIELGLTTHMQPRTAFVAIAGVLAIYTATVLGIYLWVFHASPLERADPAAWGQFGDYIGGLLNPALAVANVAVVIYLAVAVQRLNEAQRESKEESERRLQTVLELHREWNSETIYRARTSAGKLVRKFPDASYFEIEDMVPYEEASDIWVVVGFFQRLGFLTQHKKVENDMIRELFGELFYWWWVVSFSIQLDRCDCDARVQMIKLKQWFDAATTEQHRASWLYRANRDLAQARALAELPPVIVM